MNTIARTQNEIPEEIGSEVGGDAYLSDVGATTADFRLLSDLELLHACGGENGVCW